MASQTNPVVKDVPAAFAAIDASAHAVDLSGGDSHAALSTSHLQGIAQYRNYYLIGQNRKGHKNGKLFLFDATTFKLVDSIHLPVEGSDPDDHDRSYNHPGGMQVIGDYLLIPIQTQDYADSKVQLYKLSGLDDKSPTLADIELVNGDFVPASNTLRAGALGIVDTEDGFVVAVGDEATIHIFTTGDKDLEKARFKLAFSTSLDAPAGEVSLVADADGTLYLIAFTYGGDGLSYADTALLYALETSTKLLTRIDSKHCTTRSADVGIIGVHFRWGAGIYFYPDDNKRLGFLATQRVMAPSCRINRFHS